MDFIQLSLWQHTALVKGLTKGKPLGTGSQEIPAFSSSFVQKTVKRVKPSGVTAPILPKSSDLS